jgi:hypothetical protein
LLCAHTKTTTTVQHDNHKQTAQSLIQRGRYREGRAELRHMLGRQNVDAEFDTILANAGFPGGRGTRHALRAFFSRQRRPALWMSIVLMLLTLSATTAPVTILRSREL